MEWKKMNKMDAAKLACQWKDKGEKYFEQKISDLNTNFRKLTPAYRSLRDDLMNAWDETQRNVGTGSEENRRKNYLTDLIFGARMYKILQKRGMDIRFASYDDIWIYIGMRVVPEITFSRFAGTITDSPDTFKIPEDHYYRKSARIYLKSIWWYINLSLQFDQEGREDLDKTVRMLWHKNTDTLLQFVERSGKEGYRVAVYREIMKYYCEHPYISADDFRKIMILNTARSLVIEPELSAGGVKGYVDDLFAYFCK